jgi:L-threonylcarbamoyladenylate synthase
MNILSVLEGGIAGAVDDSLKILEQGGIVAYPTESFYALGVNALNEPAVKKLLHLKKRPAEKAIPVIIGTRSLLETIVKTIPFQARNLMDQFWPGALTLIFYAGEIVPELLLGGGGKIAVRIPGDSFALALAQASPFPVTATSANTSGGNPSRRAQEVVQYFGNEVDLVIDQGETPGGEPSTILDVTVEPSRVIRKGKISPDLLSASR